MRVIGLRESPQNPTAAAPCDSGLQRQPLARLAQAGFGIELWPGPVGFQVQRYLNSQKSMSVLEAAVCEHKRKSTEALRNEGSRRFHLTQKHLCSKDIVKGWKVNQSFGLLVHVKLLASLQVIDPLPSLGCNFKQQVIFERD